MQIIRRKKIEAKARYQRQKIKRGHRVPEGTNYEGLRALLQRSGTVQTAKA